VNPENVRTGVVRSQALRNLSAGAPNIDDIRALVAVLVQSDKFGNEHTGQCSAHASPKSLRTTGRRQRGRRSGAQDLRQDGVPTQCSGIFPSPLGRHSGAGECIELILGAERTSISKALELFQTPLLSG
jgi:hypothetical protein